MKSRPRRANPANTSRTVTAVAIPLLRRPWRWNQSTAGLSASVRKTAIKTQVKTWRAITTIWSRRKTPIAIPSNARTVVGRKRTTRSSTFAEDRGRVGRSRVYMSHSSRSKPPYSWIAP